MKESKVVGTPQGWTGSQVDPEIVPLPLWEKSVGVGSDVRPLLPDGHTHP